MVPTDRARRDKFLRGLNSMIARDVGITMDVARTTYAQVVERALYVERAEDRVTRDLAARREQRKATHGTVTQKGGGPNDQKRKMTESIASGERRRSRGTGVITPTVRSAIDTTSGSAGHGLVISVAVQTI